jgi:hypothetical protein
MVESQSYSYPDKLGYGETFMFGVRVMFSELAQDGLVNEFEDLVDMLGWFTRPYLEEDGKWAGGEDTWTEISKDGIGIDKGEDPLGWGQAKRRRCEGKMGLIMDQAKRMGILIKRVPAHDPDMAYYTDLGGETDA